MLHVPAADYASPCSLKRSLHLPQQLVAPCHKSQAQIVGTDNHPHMHITMISMCMISMCLSPDNIPKSATRQVQMTLYMQTAEHHCCICSSFLAAAVIAPKQFGASYAVTSAITTTIRHPTLQTTCKRAAVRANHPESSCCALTSIHHKSESRHVTASTALGPSNFNLP